MLAAGILPTGLAKSPHAARARAMKNCVEVIEGLVGLVRTELSGPHGERLARLQSATSRLRDLIGEDVQEKAPTNARAFRFEKTCVHSLVTSVVDQLSELAAGAGIELFVQCGGGSLLGDAAALGEALLGLLANAIEVTPRGGGVFLATCELADGNQYWIIQDMGCGMSGGQLGGFGRSRRARRLGSESGLEHAREEVERHGGILGVEACIGAGTTIMVWLPRPGSVGGVP